MIGLYRRDIYPSKQTLIRIISARHRKDEMKKENIVTRKWGDRRKGKTDWARVDALTDEEVEGRSRMIPTGQNPRISTGRTPFW